MAMNGELKELYAELDKRIAVMESQNTNWQMNHDSQASDYHKENRCDIKDIKEHLNKLPCDRRLSFYTHMKWQVATMWGAIVLIVGIIIRSKTGG